MPSSGLLRTKAGLIVAPRIFSTGAKLYGATSSETVQIDSVGLADSHIPPNVKAAANLFQRDFLPVHGTSTIRAADPARTEILGNFQYHYKPGFVVSPDQSAARMIFMGAHSKMEIDPAVWAQVLRLILDGLARDRL